MRQSNNKIIFLILLFIASFSISCDNAEFKEQIGDFQEAMSTSQSAIEVYYLEMNQLEREIYLLRRELDAQQDLSVIYANEKPEDVTLIVSDKALYVNGPFSPKAMQARLDALKLIGIYGSRLAELAGTDAPTVFQNDTAALGKNIVSLSNTFRELAGAGKDKSAANFVAPVAKLTGIVGRLFLERKRDKELIASIREATPQIRSITRQLTADFDEVVIPTKRTGMKATIAVLVNFYNAERKSANSTRDDRKAVLEEINEIVRAYELLTNSNPQKMIQSMADANEALLAYADSGRKKSDFTQLVARIGEFRDNAKKIIEAVQEIREIRRQLRNAD